MKGMGVRGDRYVNVLLQEMADSHKVLIHDIKARLDGSPRLINAVESTKVKGVNSSFQRK